MRAIRRRVPEDGTIWFVDAEPEPAAAPYWALHYLAPRKLVKLGTTRHRSLGWLARKAPDGVDEILIVGADREPLRMVRVDSIEGVGRKRAR